MEKYSLDLHITCPGGARTYSRGDDQYPSNAPFIGSNRYYHPFMLGLVIAKNENEIAIAAFNYEILLTGVVDKQGNSIWIKFA
jgi:hypothetical protein